MRTKKNNRRKNKLLWISSLLIAVYSASYSTETADNEDDSFTLNLNNSDLLALVEIVSTQTGINFIIDPRVRATVTVVSNSPVNDEELYNMFLSVLQVHGYSAIPSGSVVKIVPDASAKQGSIPILTNTGQGGTSQHTDQLVSKVIPLQNVSAVQLVPVLRPMVPAEGQLTVFAETNSLVITDRISNIERLLEIIKQIDKPEGEEVELVSLKFVLATHALEVLSPLVRNDNSTNSLQLIADDRTNSMLVHGNRADRKRAISLINMLDAPLESNRNTRVVSLKYADAEEIAVILRETMNGQVATRTSQIAGPGFENSDNFETFSTEENSEEDLQNELAFEDSYRLPANNTPTNGPNFLVTADKNTNALIITAPADKMENSLDIIRQLDVRRDQVLVEAVIAEINEDSIRELGVNFLLNDGQGATGLTNLGGENLLGISNALSEGVLPGSAGSGLSLALGKFGDNGIDFGLLLRAIESDSDNNILSTPTIVALNNEEAEIVVGSNVPFLTGTQLSDGNDNPFQTIERQDIGLTLKVKPKINDSNTITLELEQDASSVNSTTVTGAVDITTSTRSIKTTVLVENGQTIILGGLIDESISEAEEKVPLLGDIPLLGRAFRYNTSRKSKTNLVIFLRPIILRDRNTTKVSDTTIDRLSPTRVLRNNYNDAATAPPPIPPITIVEKPNPVLRKQPAAPVNANTVDRLLEKPNWKKMPDGSMEIEF